MGENHYDEIRRIGNICLNYKFYPGEDLYSDGNVEDLLLDAVQNGYQEKLLRGSKEWAFLYHLSPERENLLEWYPFEPEAEILEIGSGCGALTGLFSKKAKKVTCIELSEKRSLINAYRNASCENIEIVLGNFQDIRLEKKFDYVTLIGVWEYSGLYVSEEQPYVAMLERAKEYLKPNGKIIIAIENKMGMKYFNGSFEDHTGKLFSGINDYVSVKNVRTFSKPEIERIFEQVGIEEYSFYYPMPDYKLPKAVYSDIKLPRAGELRYFNENYDRERYYFFNDAAAHDQVCEDGMFDYFSNSFLIICGEKKGENSFAAYNRLRKKEYRIATEIRERAGKKTVLKRALGPEAKEHIIRQKENELKWKGILPKLEYAEGKLLEDVYEVPFIEGEDALVYLYEWRNNPEMFIAKMKELIANFLTPEGLVPFEMTKEYEAIFGREVPLNAKCLKVTNIDLTLSNLKISENRLSNFDYEWVFDFPVPWEYVLWRMAVQTYDRYATYLNKKITQLTFFERLGIDCKNIDTYNRMDSNFTDYVFGKNKAEDYLKNYQKNAYVRMVRFV